MIHTLPPEVLQLIINYLMAVPKRRLREELENSLSYSYLGSWNFIQHPENLFNLAHTCRYLKSIVYSEIFKTWICYEGMREPKSALGYCWDHCSCKQTYNERSCRSQPAHFMPMVPEFDVSALQYGEPSYILNIPKKPKFYLYPTGRNNASMDSLQYIQHLCLGFNGLSKTYCPWLAPLLSKMTCLQELTLVLNGRAQSCDTEKVTSLNLLDLEYVIDNLMLHNNTI